MQKITFLHCADIHIGAATGYLGEKAPKRRTEILMTFEKIMRLATERAVDFVLISGDLFDSNTVEAELVNGAFRAISASGIPVIAVAGNHDPLSAASPYRRKDIPQNLYVFGENDSSVNIPGLPVKIFGRSFTESYLSGEERFPLSPACELYNILVLHGDISGSGEYNPITSGFIEESGMDYIALGHIHLRSAPERRGKTVFAYPGCPEGQGFDETGEKGVYIGELNENGCSLEFAPVCQRRLEAVSVDISLCEGNDEIFALILKQLTEGFGEEYAENLYKIILTGAVCPELDINCYELSARLSEKLYFAKIKDKTTIRLDYEALARQPDLAGIFTRKMLGIAENAANTEEREKAMLALDIGLRAFRSEVKYSDDQ